MIPAKPRIGFVGAGLMGHGICKNLLEHGHPVTVIANRNRVPIDDLVARGASEARSLAEVARASDIVMTCLPNVATVEKVLGGPDGLIAHARPGTILVESTTSDPAVTVKLGAEAAARGVTLVDVPLMKGPKQAWDGELNLLCGGETAVIDGLRPVFACYSKLVFHVGPLGRGHAVKLLNNATSMCHLAAIAEIFTAAAAIGVSRKLLLEVITSGFADSRAAQSLGPRLIEDDPAMNFSVDVGLKDVDLFRRMIASAGGVTRVADATSAVFRLASEAGHGAEDVSRIGTTLAAEAGVVLAEKG